MAFQVLKVAWPTSGNNVFFQLANESQLELNTEFPLGEGNFGVVYKGVLLRSNGEWDMVSEF